jgi:hypothetical protein
LKIAPKSAVNIYPSLYGNKIPDGWKGSMVVTSDQDVAAVVVDYGYATAHNIYEGISASRANNVVLLPSAHWNPNGQEEIIAIQNVQSNPINVKLTYFDKSGTAIKGPDTYTVPGNTSLYRNTIQDCASCPGGPSGPALPAGEQPEGSARVETVNTSDKVAVASVGFIIDSTYAYSGLPAQDAGREFLAPSIHRNLGGQYSFTLVQNTHPTQSTKVTLEYRNADGSLANTFSRDIPGGGSFNFNTHPAYAAPYYPAQLNEQGSLRITSDTTDIVVNVVETLFDRPYSYNAFVVDAGKSKAKPKQLFPSFHRNLNGQFTFVLVQNPSTTDTISCNIVHKDNATLLTSSFTRDIAPQGFYNFNTHPAFSGEQPTNLGNEGSAEISCVIKNTTTPANVVAVAVETIFEIPGVYEGVGSD